MSYRAHSSNGTMLDAVRASLDLTAKGGDGIAPPAAVLWTDPDGQWRPALKQLQASIAHLYVLGTYDPSERIGPVIWLRCIIERTIADLSPPSGVVPILYLPNVSLQLLRAAGDCPREFAPLIELQYRGAVWRQKNGRDWTIEAFVTSEHGTGLEVASDLRTKEAMMRSLPVLISEPIKQLQGRKLYANDFDGLSVEDPVRDLLTWMNDPAVFREASDDTKWSSFRSVCKSKFAFDPEHDSSTVVASGFINADDRLEEVWRRFSEMPSLFPGVCNALSHAVPRDLLARQDRNPAINDRDETDLRTALATASGKPHHDACAEVLALEKQHGVRRSWVWAGLGRSTLAMALKPLAELAKLAAKPISGTGLAEMVDVYADRGWQTDRAALDAMLEARKPADVALVGKVVRALYEHWLEQTARNFQGHVRGNDANFRALVKPVGADKDTCVLFADGLRFDVGGRLQEILEARGAKVKMGHRVAPVPTVTSTGKPWASPVHGLLQGPEVTDDFSPVFSDSGQPYSADRLRKAMVSQGIDVIDDDQITIASSTAKGGWFEGQSIDDLGHKLNVEIVGWIDKEIEAIADQVFSLLNAGWVRVRVVTDHGWLLLPGELPKVDLPPSLVVKKGSRAAAAKGPYTGELPTYLWHWNPQIVVVSPPGIGVFYAAEYAHGGVTLQECVVPDLTVELGHRDHSAQIVKAEWARLRCRVTVKTDAKGLVVDLRLKRNDIRSIASEAKIVPEDGEVSLLVEDDGYVGAGAVLVVLDPSGKVLHHFATTVGDA